MPSFSHHSGTTFAQRYNRDLDNRPSTILRPRSRSPRRNTSTNTMSTRAVYQMRYKISARAGAVISPFPDFYIADEHLTFMTAPQNSVVLQLLAGENDTLAWVVYGDDGSADTVEFILVRYNELVGWIDKSKLTQIGKCADPLLLAVPNKSYSANSEHSLQKYRVVNKLAVLSVSSKLDGGGEDDDSWAWEFKKGGDFGKNYNSVNNDTWVYNKYYYYHYVIYYLNLKLDLGITLIKLIGSKFKLFCHSHIISCFQISLGAEPSELRSSTARPI